MNKKVTLLLLLLLSAAACAKQADPPAESSDRAGQPPSPEETGNTTYAGIFDFPVTLVDGRWEGPPYVEGGASRPAAGRAETFSHKGDVDGDGVEESIALIWSSTGGSGTFDYIAIVDRDESGRVINTGTAPLGDRVKVNSAIVREGRIILDVIQAGPQDAACCPRQKVRRTFVLEESGLVELSSEDLGRVPSTDPERNE